MIGDYTLLLIKVRGKARVNDRRDMIHYTICVYQHVTNGQKMCAPIEWGGVRWPAYNNHAQVDSEVLLSTWG